MRDLPGGGGRQPGRPSSGPPSWRRHSALVAVVWALLSAASLVGALLAGASPVIAGCLVVLACSAVALGWCS